jgi:hypothetical protein
VEEGPPTGGTYLEEVSWCSLPLLSGRVAFAAYHTAMTSVHVPKVKVGWRCGVSDITLARPSDHDEPVQVLMEGYHCNRLENFAPQAVL